MSDRHESCSRREFVSGLTLAGTAGLLGLRPSAAAAEPPPETARIRLVKIPTICQAPQYVAEHLLQAEGFTDVRYLPKEGTVGIEQALASGEADINMHFAAPLIIRMDAGDPVIVVAGGHVGCFELFASDRVRTMRDLKGKIVGVRGMGSSAHVFLASMVAHVGLDPQKDITWVASTSSDAMRMLAQGKIDAYLGFPPEPQELRARKIGHVVVNSAVDRPWSQYFCCMIAAHRDFVRKHPVATKRATRAILKAAEVCGLDADRASRFLVDRGFTPRYDFALQAVRDLPYGKWREYDPEDTLRFYALRLHEAGMIKSSPQKIIAQGTDWRFLNELKKELKG